MVNLRILQFCTHKLCLMIIGAWARDIITWRWSNIWVVYGMRCCLNHFLLDGFFERTCPQIFEFLNLIKGLRQIIRAWARLILRQYHLFFINSSSSGNLRFKDMRAWRQLIGRLLCVIGSNARVLLFKVYIHCNWSHIIQGILFIEG